MFDPTSTPDPIADAEQPRRSVERRRHRRFELSLPGRYMRSSKEEFTCRMIDMSVGGIAVAAASPVEMGERIVAYFEEIGGVEGTVARVFDGGFAIALTVTTHKREKLSAQITWLVNRDEFSGAEARRHLRLAATQPAQLTLDDGSVHPVRCMDVSLSGASVATKVRPRIGSAVKLGRLQGKIVRHHHDGIAIQFVSIQNQDSLKHYLG
jgi:hypothetical protein